ncbi:hypothetical protein HDU79_000201 [Rhizoclosmatium sp. JEL0117]|nr:hypothetical protein HDU79_000201 [Rhizoclosmatium sp. JEL0117]
MSWFKNALNSILPGNGSGSASATNSAASSRAPTTEPTTDDNNNNNNNHIGDDSVLARKTSFFNTGKLSKNRDASRPASPSPWSFRDTPSRLDRSPSRDRTDRDRDGAISPLASQRTQSVRMPGTGTIPRAMRSSSPAPSASSTLAAERLVRLTDAQLAELAAQVSAEAYRRRTPIGALLATYERASQSAAMRTKAPTTAARIAIMTNEKFKVFAADLDAEATRRDIPGIDIFGTKGSAAAATIANGTGTPTTGSNLLSQTLGRSTTIRTLASSVDTLPNLPPSETTPPPSPTQLTGTTLSDATAAAPNVPVKLAPIVAAAASSATLTDNTSPPQTPDQIPVTADSAVTLHDQPPSRIPSFSNLKEVSAMTPEDRAIAVDRMTNLSDDEFRALVRDLKAELESREDLSGKKAKRRGGAGLSFDEQSDDEGVTPDSEVPVRSASIDDVEIVRIGRTGGSSSVAGRSSQSPMRRRLIPAATNVSSSSTGTNLTVMQTERVTLLKGIALLDLQELWQDVEVEVNRREAAGIQIWALLNAPPPPATPSVSASPVVVIPESPIDEHKPRRKLPGEKEHIADDSSSSSSVKPEPANVVAWRSRISKLSNEQLAEVTADVFDEITRRKEKTEPFLPPREDLSTKRNEARKELAKLPSKELKTLWTIIHDNMTKRNML